MPGAVVSSDLAVGIALARTGGGVVTNVEPEFEDGRASWKVRIVKDGVRYDVYVDAATGQVVRFRQKDDDGRRGGNDDRGDNSGSGRGDDDHGGNSGPGGGHGDSGGGGNSGPG
jgi:hypothetical protein